MTRTRLARRPFPSAVPSRPTFAESSERDGGGVVRLSASPLRQSPDRSTAIVHRDSAGYCKTVSFKVANVTNKRLLPLPPSQLHSERTLYGGKFKLSRRCALPRKFTRLDAVALANDDALLGVGHVHPVVLDWRDVRASPARAVPTFVQGAHITVLYRFADSLSGCFYHGVNL